MDSATGTSMDALAMVERKETSVLTVMLSGSLGIGFPSTRMRRAVMAPMERMLMITLRIQRPQL